MDIFKRESVTLNVNGEQIVVGEILMKHYKTVKNDIASITEKLTSQNGQKLDLKSLVGNSLSTFENIIKTITGKDSKFTDELSQTQMEKILQTAWEINKDSFLMKEISKKIKAALARMEKAREAQELKIEQAMKSITK